MLLTIIARLIAVFLAVITVLATILVLLLTSIDHLLLNTETDQRAFSEQVVYEQLPALISEQYAMVKNLLGEDPQVMRQRIDTGIRFSPLLVLCLLLLIAVFGVRSLRGWLCWWGIPVFIAAFITLSAGIASLIFFEPAWASYIIPLTAESTPVQIEPDVSRALFNDLVVQLVLEAGILTLLGLIALLISRRMPPPPDPSLPPLAPPGMPGGPVLVRPISKKRK